MARASIWRLVTAPVKSAAAVIRPSPARPSPRISSTTSRYFCALAANSAMCWLRWCTVIGELMMSGLPRSSRRRPLDLQLLEVGNVVGHAVGAVVEGVQAGRGGDHDPAGGGDKGAQRRHHD